ncbi:hypothetical protein C8R44DRAFT_738840 [Mycena epipterygia]|nr:hypothetical protein C8R44DRAFT_738840 [Mycena epipterygia]
MRDLMHNILVPHLIDTLRPQLPAGWVAGNLDMDDFNLRILSFELRLSPEHVFPTGLNDCYTALKLTTTNTTELSVSLSKGFLLGGFSAGGNLSGALVHRARDDSFSKSPGIKHKYCLPADPANPDLSSLLSSHEDIPPAYVQIAGLDPLRDEAFLYERLLSWSAPWVSRKSPGLKASGKFQADFRKGIEWLLAQV